MRDIRAHTPLRFPSVEGGYIWEKGNRRHTQRTSHRGYMRVCVYTRACFAALLQCLHANACKYTHVACVHSAHSVSMTCHASMRACVHICLHATGLHVCMRALPCVMILSCVFILYKDGGLYATVERLANRQNDLPVFPSQRGSSVHNPHP